MGYGPPPHGYGPPQGHYPPPGYGPPGYPPPGYGYPPPPKKSNAVWYGLGLVALLFVTYIGMGVASRNKTKKDGDAFDGQDAVKVSPSALVSAYNKNEIAADQEYKGKKIEITGEIESISSDFSDDAVVHLKSGELFDNVSLHGIPNAEAAKLEKGKTITAVCKGAGEVVGSPMLNGCKLK